MSNDAQGAKLLGFIRLQPDLTTRHGMTLLWVCLTGIPFLVVINFVQPYILTAMLDIPASEQGSISAWLALLHELIMIALTGPAGALSDRIGRRRVLTAGYIIGAVGLAIYPWATSVVGLILIRSVYAIGASAIVASYSTFIADYPAEKSRGKLIALSGVLNGLGILIVTFIGGSLPKWLVAAGYGAIPAGRLAMLIVGTVFFVAAIICYAGFKGGDVGHNKPNKDPLLKLLRQGFGAASNPRIAVSFASAFAARGDVVVIGTYVSLWGTQVGIANGLSEADALAKATIIFGIIQLAALLSAPIIGFINDRVNRVTGLFGGMAVAAFGYLAYGFQGDPVGASAIGIACVLGVGQMAGILAGTALIGQEADPKITGATIGVWSFCGAVGTLIGSFFGGQLYDLWRPGAPFILMGFLNLLVAVWAIVVRLRYPGDKPLRLVGAVSTADQVGSK